jgi:iron-sulfur cluster repair protein YtfE (RIC family)
MSIIELLIQDHRNADQLMMQIDAGSGSRMQIFEQLRQALELHTQIEEQILYPALENYDETRGQAEHSYEEHDKVKELLQELSGSSIDDASWMQSFQELKQNVQHHVQEEETSLLPKAKQVLGNNRLMEMGQQAMAVKQSHPTMIQ